MPDIGETAPDFELSSDAGEIARLVRLPREEGYSHFFPKAGTKG